MGGRLEIRSESDQRVNVGADSDVATSRCPDIPTSLDVGDVLTSRYHGPNFV